MPLAAAVVCTGLGFALRGQWRLIGLLAAAGALALGLVLVDGVHGWRAVERGDSYRLAIWQQFAARVAHRPWLGEGVLTDDTTQIAARDAGAPPLTMNHPHSVYLATALYGGLPALGLLAALLAAALRQGVAAARGGEPAWLLVLLVGLLCMLTDGDRLLHAPRGIWFYFWLPVGVLMARQTAGRDRRSLTAWPATGDRPE
jgi:O-antigen ligase